MRRALEASYYPVEAREGHAIVCLTGGIAPFVLRQSQSLNGQHYTFIGPVIVHHRLSWLFGDPARDSAFKLSSRHRIGVCDLKMKDAKEDPPIEEFHII